jgi:two-component system CheB/CheR fusion protein
VLLVEDNPESLAALCELLKGEGALVAPASSAKEALERADREEFELVISDIAMPGMDGLELVAELRRRPHSARWPAIAVTGFGRPDDAQKALAAGFDAHLAKPLSLDALLRVLVRLVAGGTVN